ncbi:RNA-directed DNA polymerase from mobile element jockey [Nymphon striatum]|nr:RNA-directed DNA polymerase from mobile element jockey [Nymphon striatum]
MEKQKPHPLKRTRSQSDIEFLNVNKKVNKNEIKFKDPNFQNLIKDATTIIWPRFLVVKANAADKISPLLKLSPFAVYKTIISITGGEPKSVKKLISGDILIETKTKLQTDRLLKSKDFFNIPVTVSPHGSLNYSKGVIRSRELKDCSETELLEELSSQGITAVKKMLITRNGQKITTGTIILTFNIPEPPKSIKAAYLNVSVDKYIPNPLRCFKCQKFGHHQTSCKHEAVCGRCGEANHSDNGCEKTPCCVNCKGKHPSYSRECPNFTLEKKIVTHKYNYNTTFPEARRMVLSLHSPTSYAKVAATNTKKMHPLKRTMLEPKLTSSSQLLKHRAVHLSAGTYSALDLTLCHPSLLQDFTWMVDGDLHTSDHFPIHVKGNGPPIKGRPQRWKLHKADWTMFKQLCAEQLNISSLAEMNAVRERKRLLRKFSLRPTSDNLSSYRQAAAAARRTIRQAKRESWRQYVSKLNSQSSIKSAWDRLRKIRGKGTSDAYKHLNVGGTAITSQFGIANALGQSFCKNSSSENCTESFRSYKNRAESHQLDFKTTNAEVYNQVFSLEELRRSLRASKDTSPGPDSIHYQMLKHLPDCSLALMLNIFNTIWITGAIPSSWREATVIPIPKPGKDHTDPSNYRPIALTSCICKTMERMINCRLTYYLESNNILTRCQSGFRRHRSTIDHLVRFETLVREAFIRREHLAAVFFDLEKAYETTWKYGILRDLFNSGLRGRMPIFINHFLTNRKFRVRVGTTFSDHFDLEMGVPQGSILSVTLFSLKINDIVNHVKSGTECFLYVDDLVVAYASKSISTIERHLQLSLNKIEKWTNENGFKFSSSKTVSMHFCLLTRPHHDPQLRLGSSPIPLVNSTRFLGLIFDKKLNFLKHMQVLKSKCFKALNLLRILSNTNWGADRKVMLRFYRSLIRSKLDYGSVVYGSARKSYLRVLDPVHNQGLRLSLGAFRTTPAESLYVEAHEPSLYLRREKLSLQYACRLRANPENSCYDVTFHPNHRETFARRQNSIPTFGLRVLPVFEQIGLPLGNIARCVLPSIPPWTMLRPIINFSLTGLKKGTTPSYVYLNKFLEVSDSYHGYHHIYTDGSRQNDEVAAAAISSLTSLSSRLPDKSSIFSAESKALLLALDIVENSTYGRYIILSDSLSCLMALDNMKYSHPTICEILLKLHILSSSNHVIFCWLPSHVGISGNEKADLAAKSALSLPVDPQFISYRDFYMYIFKHILSIWQSKWDGEINNKLHAIKPKLGEWALACRKSRKEESILCRLRVGHSYLTHSFY